MDSPRLVLMCGLTGAGKSTYARALEAQGFRRFAIDHDAWDLGYTDASTIPVPVVTAIRRRQRAEIAAALDDGMDVVVDHLHWSRRQRDDLRAFGRAHGAQVEVVFVDADPDVLRERLARRRGEGRDDFVVPPALFDDFRAGFQPPGDDETDVRRIRTDLPGPEPGDGGV